MTKEEFQELLRRYNAGDCSLDEIQQINNWFNKISDESLELNEFEKTHVQERLLAAVRRNLSSQEKQIRKVSAPFFLLKVAAALLVIILAVYAVSSIRQFVPSDSLANSEKLTGQVRYANSTATVMKVLLPDSSTVELKPNAEISYQKKWDGQKREIRLVGEAFFNVVKDSKRPFFVYGGEVVTKVLGTSFSVKAAMNATSIEVAVRTGKVSVYEEPSENDRSLKSDDITGVILTPNEKVEYFVTDKHWVTSLVKQPQPLPASNKEVDFVFNNAPIVSIKELIERTYSIDIIMENESSYSSCTFTGDVSMMELYDLLNVICKSTNTNYEVKGTKILITGPGCQ
jgi:transmembrane sensor